MKKNRLFNVTGLFNRQEKNEPPKGFLVGFLFLGLPLAVGFLIANIAISNTTIPEKPIVIPEPKFDAVAYTANTSAPDDVDFTGQDTFYATSDNEINRIATESKDIVGTKSYLAANYVAVATEITPMSYGEGSGTAQSASNITDGSIATGGSGTALSRSLGDISDQIWADDNVTTYNSFTSPETLAGNDGTIGRLSIPKINLNVPVYQTVTKELDAMLNGVAHFNNTSAWDGNVGLCAHNSTPTGTGAYFKDLHLLGKGDTISYTTSLGTRNYTVTAISRISQDDWGSLGRSDDNRITLITCVNDNASKRLAVQAVAN